MKQEGYDLLYLDPNTHHGQFNRVPNYSKSFEYGKFSHGLPHLQLLLDFNPESWLDVGCGYNTLIKEVREKYVKDSWGIDFACPVADQVCDVLDLPFFDKRWDLVTAFDVMEHILEDVTVFKNFHQSLKDKGMLLISTPSDQEGSDVHDEDDHSFIDEHVRDGYNIKEIEEKLKNAGFSSVEARYSYGTPGKISWKLSMKYPILMINASKLFFVILPLYYVITYPFSFILNYLDVNMKHKTGTGLIVKAFK